MTASTAIPETGQPRPSGFATAAGHDQPVAVWPILLVLYATLLPRELRVEIGPLILFADRLVLIPVLPYLARRLMAGAVRLILPDVLVLFSAGWMAVSMMVHYGFMDGLERGGALVFDIVIGYLLARISFRSLPDIRRVLILLAPGLFLAGVAIMVESLLNRPIVQAFAEQIFGRLPTYEGGQVAGWANQTGSVRFGMLRGKGPFSHAILAGLYLSTLVAVYNLSGLRGWPRWLSNLAALLSLFTLSSTAVLALILSWFLLGFEWLQARVRELSWRLLALAAGSAALIITLTTNSGISGLIGRYLTFEFQTAYFRQLVWRYGMQSVGNHPWFGIGYAGYERPLWMVTESIDAWWLLLAVRFGLPSALGMALAVIVAIHGLSDVSSRCAWAERRFYRGLAMSMFVLAISLFSVSIWGNLQALFNILLGGCVTCMQRARAEHRISG